MKFELSIFVIWSGPVDKVAVFQIEIFKLRIRILWFKSNQRPYSQT